MDQNVTLPRRVKEREIHPEMDINHRHSLLLSLFHSD